jgi:hypothetical protein
MHAVAAPSYDGAPAVLDYEANLSDELYVLTDALGIRCFFMCASVELASGPARQPAVFMGLSAAREELKGTGEVRQLFLEFARDVREREARHGRRELLFATFATPSTHRTFELLFDEVAPTAGGDYDEQYRPWLPEICSFLRAAGDPNVPFRLPSHARGTRYSAAETARIASICQRKNFDLFTRLDVDERRGDRLILCARARSSL